MTDEQILKLLKSPIEEDIIIGMNLLCKRTSGDVSSFIELYGSKSTATTNWTAYYNILDTKVGSFNYINIGKISLLWHRDVVWIIDSEHYKSDMEEWKNVKI